MARDLAITRMSDTASNSQKKQGILSFFQNPGKTERVEQVTRSGSENGPSDIIDLPEESDGENDSSLTIQSSIESDISTQSTNICESDEFEPEPNVTEEIDNENSGTAVMKKVALTSEQQDEHNLIEQKKKEGRILKKQQDKIERERKKVQQKKERERKRELERENRERKKQQEKEEREKKRQEEKDERDRKKLEEKEEKERKRLEEKELKEQERLKKEEEKRKKEEAKAKSQSRIGAFFKKATISSSETEETSDYKKYFLPFYVKSDVIMATNWKIDPKSLEKRESKIDDLLKSSFENTSIEWLNSKRLHHGYDVSFTAVEVLQNMTSKTKSDEELHQLLSKVPQKFIKFYENVRPPYVGTYSKKLTLPRGNPFSTEGTGFNYEYDSDLDWVNDEDEEGGGVDDLENEEDEDEEDQEEDEVDNEMEGFVDKDDNENSLDTKRKKFIGPLIPTIKLRSALETLDPESQNYFHLVSVECLYPDLKFPVDPLKAPPKRSNEEHDISEPNSKNSTPTKKAKTLITESKDLLKLLEQVHDSTFSLGTITEILQKHLPQYKKDTIKNTVKEYAAKSTKGQRKWQLKDLKSWESLKETSSNS